MKTDSDDRRIRDLVFRPGKTGFVFYDDRSPFSGRCDEVARTWAFSTINEAAAWLLDQFTMTEEEGKRPPAEMDAPSPPATSFAHPRSV